MLFKGKNVLITGRHAGNWPRHCAVVGRKGRVSRFILLLTRARDSIVLRSDFVEAIQHFGARPQYCNTQPEDKKGVHFLISS